MGPDPSIFIINLQDANKNLFFSAYFFLKGYIYIIFQRQEVKNKSQNSRNQGFLLFCLIIEESGFRIRLRIHTSDWRIRIRNTGWGDWPGRCDLYCDGWAAPPALPYRTVCPWQELPSCTANGISSCCYKVNVQCSRGPFWVAPGFLPFSACALTSARFWLKTGFASSMPELSTGKLLTPCMLWPQSRMAGKGWLFMLTAP